MVDQLVVFGRHFVELLYPTALLLQIIGMTLGVLIGALPGLNATLGIALLTPITFAVPTEYALAVLISLYIGVMFGGSISAILINIPGTGSAVATLFDGYPLALQGKAADAIMVSRWTSAVGSVWGLIFFLIGAPLLSALAMNFTSPEYFWLGVMGIMVCGSFSSPDAPLKGWVSGLVGLLISFVGIEDIHATKRFTFGMTDLFTGVELISAMMGFFGIPSIISALHKVRIVAPLQLGQARLNIFRYLKDNFYHIFRWSAIGVWIGALPGVGENVAAFMAYADAKKNHPEGPQMGKGAWAGVAAPETANNSAIGGALLPMLTLGVPGSPPAAVLMGALMLHNLKPGPLLPKENPEIIAQIGAIQFVGTLLTLVVGAALVRPMVRILKVRPEILMPIIAALVVIGSFAMKSSLFDVRIMLLFGVIGYFFDKLDINAAPLVMGLILGPIIDFSLRRTLIVNQGDPMGFFSRPLSLALIALIVLSFVWPIWAKHRERKQSTAQPSS
ncbi:MAG: tripartite tricarboxylate transporter permease [Anaerolineae bacterium]|nr:tripartite tricarboxylate transporter permease [Anaerolineae bacterium]